MDWQTACAAKLQRRICSRHKGCKFHALAATSWPSRAARDLLPPKAGIGTCAGPYNAKRSPKGDSEQCSQAREQCLNWMESLQPPEPLPNGSDIYFGRVSAPLPQKSIILQVSAPTLSKVRLLAATLDSYVSRERTCWGERGPWVPKGAKVSICWWFILHLFWITRQLPSFLGRKHRTVDTTLTAKFLKKIHWYYLY